MDNDSTPGTLYHSALRSVRPQHAQPHAHSHTSATSHTSHTDHNHTYAHPPSVLHTHTENHGPEGQVPRCGAHLHAAAPSAYSWRRTRTPARCAAVPPTYAHRQATQRSRPAPSHGATAARHRTSRASRCRRPAALYPLARASTHDAHERSSALYSGNGPPEAPTPGSRAAVLSPTSNDGATHDSVHCTHHRAPRVGTLHAEIPTPPCHVSIPAASPLHRACGFGCQ